MSSRTFFLEFNDPMNRDLAAFRAHLQQLERTPGSNMLIVGVSEHDIRRADGTSLGITKGYSYRAVGAPPLHVIDLRAGPPVTADAEADEKAWDEFIAPIAFNHDVLSRVELDFGDGLKQHALARPVDEAVSVEDGPNGSVFLQGAPGWEWLVPRVDGKDLVVEGRATWWGGPRDSEDPGGTASGIVNTRQNPNFRGCSLAMNGFKNSANTLGSPLPRFKWGTLVEVTCAEGPAKGDMQTLTLIDLGPAKRTQKAIDLTESAFSRFASTSKGVVNVSYRIRDWLAQVDPRSPKPNLIGTSASKSNDDGTPRLAGPIDGNFEQMVAALGLAHVTGDLVLEPTSNTTAGVRNSTPPQVLWQNILPALAVVNAAAAQFNGARVRVNSSYRNPRYNDAVGGADLSQHMGFRALDFSLEGVRPRDIGAWLETQRGQSFVLNAALTAGQIVNPAGLALPLHAAGLGLTAIGGGGQTRFTWRGGLGVYARFVHLDVRGSEANWA